MSRAFSSSWRRLQGTVLWALLLIALTASSAFAGKPSVAVLGLEVFDPNGNIDTPTTTVARDLTEGLRSRAKSGTGPYQLATGSDKELIDEKLINNCDNEAIGCMSEIGKNLGADFLVYGRLEKKSDGYAVTINLLNVNKKRLEKARTPLMIPFTQKDGPSLAAAAKRAYNDLVGVSEAGTLVVKANAQTGKVLIDDEPRGTLSGGTARIGQLSEGRYRLAIEAEGFQRSDEVTITIRNGETTTQPVTLTSTDMSHEITGSTSSGKKMNIWKPIFGVAVVAGLGLGGYSFYKWTEWRGAEGKFTVVDGASQDDCGTARAAMFAELKDLCDNRSLNIKTGIAAGIVGVIALGTGYMAFFRGSSETQQASSTVGRRTKRRPQFSVTPILSPESGGATFQLDW